MKDTTDMDLVHDDANLRRRVLPGWATPPRLWAAAGVAALIAGFAFNRDWLVAAGVAPILVSILPCAAMCALGLCMRGGGRDCAKSGADAAGPAAPSVGPQDGR